MNNFAISSEGIGEALMRSAAALGQANNDLDKSIALVVAANNVVQNPETVGTALRTVALRIRGAKTELEEMGESTDGLADSTSKLRDEIKALSGVDIMVDNTTFKDTYEIMRELSYVWDKLSDVSQANILEKLGGKRGAQVIASIITNVEDLEAAYASAANAAGSAAIENAKYLESIEGRLKQLSASWQEFWDSSVINTGLKAGISALNNLVKALDSIGGIDFAITLAGVVGLTKAIKNLGKLTGVTNNMFTSLKNLRMAMKNQNVGIGGLLFRNDFIDQATLKKQVDNYVSNVVGAYNQAVRSYGGTDQGFSVGGSDALKEIEKYNKSFTSSTNDAIKSMIAAKRARGELITKEEEEAVALRMLRAEEEAGAKSAYTLAASHKALAVAMKIGIQIIIALAINLVSKYIEQQKQLKQSILDNAKTQVDLARNLRKVSSEFDKVNEEFKLGRASQDEFRESIEKVNEALGDQKYLLEGYQPGSREWRERLKDITNDQSDAAARSTEVAAAQQAGKTWGDRFLSGVWETFASSPLTTDLAKGVMMITAGKTKEEIDKLWEDTAKILSGPSGRVDVLADWQKQLDEIEDQISDLNKQIVEARTDGDVDLIKRLEKEKKRLAKQQQDLVNQMGSAYSGKLADDVEATLEAVTNYLAEKVRGTSGTTLEIFDNLDVEINDAIKLFELGADSYDTLLDRLSAIPELSTAIRQIKDAQTAMEAFHFSTIGVRDLLTDLSKEDMSVLASPKFIQYVEEQKIAILTTKQAASAINQWREANAYAERQTSTLTGVVNTSKEAIDNFQDAVSKLTSIMKADYSDNAGGLIDDLQELIDIVGKMDEKISTDIFDKLNNSFTIEELVAAMKEGAEAAADFQLDAFVESINLANPVLENALRLFLKQQKAVEQLTNDLDSFKSAYENLTGVVKSYNENGMLTADAISSILSMSPEYLAALQVEGDQLTINKEALQNIAVARLEDAKAQIEENFQMKVQAINAKAQARMTNAAAKEVANLAESEVLLASAMGMASTATRIHLDEIGKLKAELGQDINFELWNDEDWADYDKAKELRDFMIKNIEDVQKAAEDGSLGALETFLGVTEKAEDKAEEFADKLKSAIDTTLSYWKRALDSGAISWKDYISELAGILDQYGDQLKLEDKLTLQADLAQAKVDMYSAGKDAAERYIDRTHIKPIEDRIDALNREKDKLQENKEAQEKYYGSIIDNLNDQKQAYEDQIKAVEKYYEAQIKPLSDRQKAIEKESKALKRQKRDYEDQITVLERSKRPYQQMQKAIDKEVKAIEKEVRALEKSKKPYEQQQKAINKEIKAIEKEVKALERTKKPYEDQVKAIEKQVKAIEKQVKALEKSKRPYEDQKKAIDKQVKAIEKQVKALEKAKKPYEQQQKAINKQIKAIEKEIKAIQKTEKPYKDEQKAIQKSVRAIEDKIQALEDMKTPYEEQLDLLNQQISATEREIALLERSKYPYQDRAQAIQNEIDAIEYQIEVMERAGTQYKRQQDALNKEIELINRQVSALEQQKRPYEIAQREIEKRIYLLEREQKELEKLKKPYEEEIEALEKELEAMQKANEERQEALELQKAEYNLRRAQQQRTNLVYQDGQFQYLADQNAIKEAQETIDNLKYEKSVKKVQDAIDALQSKIDGIIAQSDEIQDEIDELTDKNEDLAFSIEKIQWEIDPLQDKIDELEYKVEGLGWSINDVGYTVTGLKYQVEDLGLIANDLAESIRLIDVQIQPFNQSLRGLQDAASDLQIEIDKIQQSIDPLSQEIEELNRRSEELQRMIDDIEESLEPLQEQIEELNEQNDSLQESIDEITEAIEPLQEQIEELNEQGDAIQEKIDEIDEAITGLQDTIEELNEQSEEVQEHIQAVEEEIDNLNEKIEGLNETSEQIQEIIDAIDEAIEPLQERIEELNDQSAEIQENIDKIDEAIEDLRINYIEPLDDALEALSRESEDLGDAIDELKEKQEQETEVLRAQIEILDEQIDHWEKAKTAASEAIDAQIEALDGQIKELENGKQAWEDYKKSFQDAVDAIEAANDEELLKSLEWLDRINAMDASVPEEFASGYAEALEGVKAANLALAENFDDVEAQINDTEQSTNDLKDSLGDASEARGPDSVVAVLDEAAVQAFNTAGQFEGTKESAGKLKYMLNTSASEDTSEREGLKTLLENVKNEAKQTAAEIDGIIDAIGRLWNQHANIRDIGNWFDHYVKQNVEAAHAAIDPGMIEAIDNLARKFEQECPGIAATINQTIVEALGNVKRMLDIELPEAAKRSSKAIKDEAKDTADYIDRYIRPAIERTASETKDQVIYEAEQARRGVAEESDRLVREIQQDVDEILDYIEGSNGKERLARVVRDMIDEVNRIIRDFVEDDLPSHLREIESQVENAVRNIVQALGAIKEEVDSIKGHVQATVEAAGNLGGALWDAVEPAKQIKEAVSNVEGAIKEANKAIDEMPEKLKKAAEAAAEAAAAMPSMNRASQVDESMSRMAEPAQDTSNFKNLDLNQPGSNSNKSSTPSITPSSKGLRKGFQTSYKGERRYPEKIAMSQAGQTSMEKMRSQGYDVVVTDDKGKEILARFQRYARGGVVSGRNGIDTLESLARAVGEDRMIAARDGERVLTVRQNQDFEKLVNLSPQIVKAIKDVQSKSRAGVDIDMGVDDAIKELKRLESAVDESRLHIEDELDAALQSVLETMDNSVMYTENALNEISGEGGLTDQAVERINEDINAVVGEEGILPVAMESAKETVGNTLNEIAGEEGMMDQLLAELDADFAQIEERMAESSDMINEMASTTAMNVNDISEALAQDITNNVDNTVMGIMDRIEFAKDAIVKTVQDIIEALNPVQEKVDSIKGHVQETVVAMDNLAQSTYNTKNALDATNSTLNEVIPRMERAVELASQVNALGGSSSSSWESTSAAIKGAATTASKFTRSSSSSSSSSKKSGQSDLEKAMSLMSPSNAAEYKKRFGHLYDSQGNKKKTSSSSSSKSSTVKSLSTATSSAAILRARDQGDNAFKIGFVQDGRIGPGSGFVNGVYYNQNVGNSIGITGNRSSGFQARQGEEGRVGYRFDYNQLKKSGKTTEQMLADVKGHMLAVDEYYKTGARLTKDKHGTVYKTAQEASAGLGLTKAKNELENKLKKNSIVTKASDAIKKGLQKILGYGSGGVIPTRELRGPLDAIARAAGEDKMVAVENGERVLTPQQNENFENFVKLTPELINASESLAKYAKLFNDISTQGSYATEDNIARNMKNVVDRANFAPVNNIVTLNIGDINVHGVNDADDLARQIKNNLPNALLQRLGKAG